MSDNNSENKPALILDKESFKEQANILCMIQVRAETVRFIVNDTDVDLVPHFYYQRIDPVTNTIVFDTRVLVEQATYYDEEDPRLKKAWLESLVQSLESKHKKYDVSKWEWMVDIWNGGVGNAQIIDDMKMPDYRDLEADKDLLMRKR